MKIGFFTDTHYCQIDYLGDTRRPSLSYEKIKVAMSAFEKEGVDLVFCLGDLTDKREDDTRESCLENLEKISNLINSYKTPFYLILGNHDHLLLNQSDYKAKFDKIAPYVFEKDDITFIMLDANYRSSMKSFDEEGEVWYDANVPPQQMELLRKALKECKQAVILIHECLDPTIDSNHIVRNAGEVRQIIREAGNVKMVIQGHFHPGGKSIIDDIPYIIIPAMCEREEIPYKIMEI
ncbi:MAG: metallophosphoesterase [Clostridia bacterium]|nr:metallophosphoesterase [Clostridia bacterium]